MMTLTDLIDESMKDSNCGEIEMGLIQKAVEKIKTEREETAVDSCKELLQFHSNFLKARVSELRFTREKEKNQAALVKRFSRAFRFFHFTGNPFPLFLAENENAKKNDGSVQSFCRSLSLAIPDENSDAWNIPKDWFPNSPFDQVKEN